MAMKCYHKDTGFCKFGNSCRFAHPSMQVCGEISCGSRVCERRHPKPCRNYFLRNCCRFGKECKFSNSFDCEICDKMSHLVQKEVMAINENLKKKEETIERIANEFQNLKKKVKI